MKLKHTIIIAGALLAPISIAQAEPVKEKAEMVEGEVKTLAISGMK